MDQLFSKLTSLSYELFGIFVPGFILSLFLVWWWWCVGDLSLIVSFGYLPVIGMRGVSQGFGLVPDEIKLGLVVYIVVVSYFLGHLINWVGRSGGAKESVATSKIRRAASNLGRCLIFSVPKPRESYYQNLDPLLSFSIGRLGLPSEASNWSAFYPVAKSWISQDLQHSLISTYQNKYTLHRSLTIASVIWFWLSATMIVFWLAFSCHFNAGPRLIPMVLSIVFSLMAAWGFSESYKYNWQMFGNTVITESFMLLSRSEK